MKNGPYLETLLQKLAHPVKISFDIIHSCFYPYFNLVLALMLGKFVNKPTVCTPFFHFSNPRYLNQSYFEPLRKFDTIIACTHLEKKILQEKLGILEDKIKVVPMGVDYEKFIIPPKGDTKRFSFKQKYFKSSEVFEEDFFGVDHSQVSCCLNFDLSSR